VSPKKSKRSQAAQQLIDDLLEEIPPSKSPSNAQSGAQANDDEREIAMSDVTGSFGPVEKDPNQNVVFEGEGTSGGLKLETSQKIVLDPVQEAQQKARQEPKPSEVATRIVKREETPDPSLMRHKEKPPFQGESPVVTKLAQRSKIVRPAEDEVLKEERQRPEADIDFGEMSAEDPFEGKAPSARSDEDRTMRVVQPSTLVAPPEPRPQVATSSREKEREKEREQERTSTKAERGSIDRGGATEIRPGVRIPPSPKLASAGSSSTPTSFEGALRQSESLRIAQNRITDLERELERVRRDNEALSTAGDTLRRRADELASKAESLEIQAREAGLRLEEEKKVLRGQLQAKDRENAEMRARVDEIEARLESNFKKIRVRERELEHRLEIVKMESATLVSTKDKMLLDLKRQIDQLHQESDSAKMKSQEMFSQYKEKQETIRRVVRALRIALTILEGDNENVAPLKKVD
jgi:hypothetical protein